MNIRRLSTITIALATLAAVPGGSAAGSLGEVVSRVRVSFRVQHANATNVRCTTDAAEYTIAGVLTAPARFLERPPHDLAATLLLHEFSFGKFFWTFDDVVGYDFAAALARKDHVTIAIDRLGYDESGHPPGAATCAGAHADIVAQIVRQMKEGAYTVRGDADPVAFGDVVLAGHSVGGGIAELAAHSFPDIEIAGLILFAWADQGYSARAVQQSVAQAQRCAPGGEPAYEGGPGGYAYFGHTDQEFRDNVFADTEPEVVDIVTRLRNRDPCGDNASLLRLAAINAVGVGSLTIPVLLVYGDQDAVFEDAAADVQARLFRSSPSVTLRRVSGAGHALTLERSAARVQSRTAAWLARMGFKGA